MCKCGESREREDDANAYSFNGGRACDALTGHCSCGAYHTFSEIITGQRELTWKGRQLFDLKMANFDHKMEKFLGGK